MAEPIVKRIAIASGIILLACCGGGGGGEDDTSIDSQMDTTDTEDAPVDTAGDDFAGETECADDGDCEDSDPCTIDSCDLDYGECLHEAVDADGDGYPAMEVEGTTCAGGTDCLDDLATAYPGAPLVECSLLDNDCNENTDHDNDGDGHVDYGCAGGDDCDDSDAVVLLGDCSEVNDCCDGCWRQGCWLDPTTGHLWEDPPLGALPSWDAAATYCSSLSLVGYGAGEWRLPTISEFRTLIRGCPASEEGGACGVTDACLDSSCRGATECSGCGGGTGPDTTGCGSDPDIVGCYWDPALEGPDRWYWSSSTVADAPTSAWGVHFASAAISSSLKGIEMSIAVRCMHPGS